MDMVKIGLQCKTAEYPSKFYGIDTNGSLYNDGVIEKVEDQKRYDFGFVIVCYDSRRGVIRVCGLDKDNHNGGDLRIFDEIEPGNYQLAFYFNGKGNKVEITEYYNTLHVILGLSASCYPNFRAKAREFMDDTESYD